MLNGIPGIEEVHMTTNGVTLSRKLPALKTAGLTGLNVSLDTLTPAKFQFITRRRGADKVMESVKRALTLEISQVKVYTVAYIWCVCIIYLLPSLTDCMLRSTVL